MLFRSVEAKLLPFNSWAKGILASSNSLSGPMIASVYAAAISLVFGRLLTNVFVIEGTLLTIVMGILVFSLVAGEAMAFSSKKVKEILLYSSVSQAALVVLVFMTGFAGWAVYLIIGNATAKLVLFLVTNIAAKQLGDDEVDTFKGLFTNNKVVGLAFTAVTLSVVGLPFFFGFVTKMNILENMFLSGV